MSMKSGKVAKSGQIAKTQDAETAVNNGQDFVVISFPGRSGQTVEHKLALGQQAVLKTWICRCDDAFD